MKFTDRVKNAVSAFTVPTKKQANSVPGDAAHFLRYGNGSKPMMQDWSQVEMTDQDMYTGYSYAAIKKRANRTAVLGKRYLKTEASESVMNAAQKAGKEVEHPYIALIRNSKEFTEKKFWHDISTYLDLEGVYYLMAVRAVAQKQDGTPKVGVVQKFVMMNPYNVKKVVRESDGTLGGYIEYVPGLGTREIPKEMVIEVRQLNPFDNDLPYSMTDAAKESQFTLKQASDYTRHSIKNNINAPGAITTELELDDHVFDNFVSRIRNHEKGEPLYGNGAGSVNWTSMQIDMDKSALDKINEINRSVLFSVSGVSKTTMGIEESGTGREVSKTQKDDFTENAIMPQIEDIIDALNMDYRKFYPEWEKERFEIILDNPLESDREAELKDIEIRQSELDLRDALVTKGYEYDLASKYAHGDLTLEELGEPTLVPEITDAEAEAIVSREMGLDDDVPEDETPTEPDADTKLKGNKNRVVANNAMTLDDFSLYPRRRVTLDQNEKKIAEARKRITKQLKEEKSKPKEAPKEETPTETPKAEQKNHVEDEHDMSRTVAAVNKDFYDDLPGMVCVVLDDIEADYKNEPWFNEAWEQYREHVMTSDIDDMKMPGFVFGKYIKDRNAVSRKLVKNEVAEKTNNQIASRDFPDLYEGIDIDMNDLGCIMLNTEKIPVAQYVKNFEKDLFTETNYDQDALPSETVPHVTLLFGLLENGNVWKDKVDMLLKDWKAESVTIEEVSYFDLGDSYAVIGLVEKTPELVDGHERLTLLPHINTFSEYHPHITLAYIKKEADVDRWVKILGKKYNGQKVVAKGINYGDTPEERAKSKDDDDDSSDNGISVEAKQAILTPVEGPKTVHNHNHEHEVNETLELAKNALNSSLQNQVVLQESSLQQAVARLEQQVVNAALAYVQETPVDEVVEVVPPEQEAGFVAELTAIFIAYYTILFPIYAAQLFAARLGQYSMQGIFAMTDDVENYIRMAALNAAQSHLNTILKDLNKAYDQGYEQSLRDSLIAVVEEQAQAGNSDITEKLPENPNREDVAKAVDKGKFDADPAYELARELATTGIGYQAIAKNLQQTYQNMTKTRAVTIARHESNRVFTMSQYQADLQFLTESGLKDRAYKRLRNRAGSPCPVCNLLVEKTNKNPIPFEKNFADLGDELTARYEKTTGQMAVQKVSINYEAIQSGNVHVNCRCEYELVIKRDDGTFYNAVDFRVHNDVDSEINPYRDSQAVKELEELVENKTSEGYNPFRDKKGRFASGPTRFANLAPNNFLNATREEFGDQGTWDEYQQDAINEYVDGSGHDTINRYLREPNNDIFDKERLEDYVKGLDESMKNSLKHDTLLYRGFGTTQNIEPGMTINYKGFNSTSFNPGVALKFAVNGAQTGVKRPVVLRIKAKKGQKGLAPVLSDLDDSVHTSLRSNEYEYILPRNLSFKVTKVEDAGDYEIAEVEINE